MSWARMKAEFLNVKPKSDADRAAQFIVRNLKDKEMLSRAYHESPDLFDLMDHPRLNYLMYLML